MKDLFNNALKAICVWVKIHKNEILGLLQDMAVWSRALNGITFFLSVHMTFVNENVYLEDIVLKLFLVVFTSLFLNLIYFIVLFFFSKI